jgi:hypothetical protein
MNTAEKTIHTQHSLEDFVALALVAGLEVSF